MAYQENRTEPNKVERSRDGGEWSRVEPNGAEQNLAESSGWVAYEVGTHL